MKSQGLWLSIFLILVSGCKLERPDPVTSVMAILHKHPSDFIAQLTALDVLAAKEVGLTASLTGSHWIDDLYRQAAQLKPILANAASDSEKVQLLKNWVYDSLRFIADIDSNPLANSIPSQVLFTKKGSCLGLSLIFLAFGQILDLPLYPVFLPSHIFVRYRSQSFTTNIETLRKGLARTDEFYRDTFALTRRPWYTLEDGHPKQALAALVFNLANFHREKGQSKYAQAEYQLTEEALPGYPEALGNQGAGLMLSGDLKNAETLLLAAWKGDSIALPARLNLARLYLKAGDSVKANGFTTR